MPISVRSQLLTPQKMLQILSCENCRMREIKTDPLERDSYVRILSMTSSLPIMGKEAKTHNQEPRNQPVNLGHVRHTAVFGKINRARMIRMPKTQQGKIVPETAKARAIRLSAEKTASV